MKGLACIAVSVIAAVAPSIGAGPGVPATRVAAQELPLEALLGRVQERYRSLRDLRSRFTQVVTPRAGGRTTTASGDWMVKPPGRMRMQYDDPPRLFVADGESMYWYLPEDRQVQVLAPAAVDPRYTPSLYLAGEGDLRQDFAVSGTEWAAPMATGNVQLMLEPRAEDARFDHLILEIEPDSALIVRLVSIGLLGEVSEYRFEEIATDVGLDEELFRFSVPAGATVEYLGS